MNMTPIFSQLSGDAFILSDELNDHAEIKLDHSRADSSDEFIEVSISAFPSKKRTETLQRSKTVSEMNSEGKTTKDTKLNNGKTNYHTKISSTTNRPMCKRRNSFTEKLGAKPYQCNVNHFRPIAPSFFIGNKTFNILTMGGKPISIQNMPYHISNVQSSAFSGITVPKYGHKLPLINMCKRPYNIFQFSQANGFSIESNPYNHYLSQSSHINRPLEAKPVFAKTTNTIFPRMPQNPWTLPYQQSALIKDNIFPRGVLFPRWNTASNINNNNNSFHNYQQPNNNIPNFQKKTHVDNIKINQQPIGTSLFSCSNYLAPSAPGIYYIKNNYGDINTKFIQHPQFLPAPISISTTLNGNLPTGVTSLSKNVFGNVGNQSFTPFLNTNINTKENGKMSNMPFQIPINSNLHQSSEQDRAKLFVNAKGEYFKLVNVKGTSYVVPVISSTSHEALKHTHDGLNLQETCDQGSNPLSDFNIYNNNNKDYSRSAFIEKQIKAIGEISLKMAQSNKKQMENKASLYIKSNESQSSQANSYYDTEKEENAINKNSTTIIKTNIETGKSITDITLDDLIKSEHALMNVERIELTIDTINEERWPEKERMKNLNITEMMMKKPPEEILDFYLHRDQEQLDLILEAFPSAFSKGKPNACCSIM